MDLREKLKNLPEKTWKSIQAALAILFTLAIGFCLFYDQIMGIPPESNTGFISIPLLIAIVLVLAVPRMIEARLEVKLTFFRRVLLIGLIIVVVAGVALLYFELV